MSESTLYRAHFADIELRGSDKRTIAGLAVPYNEETEIREMGRTFREVFRPGVFKRSIVERGSNIKLMALHDAITRFALGKATTLREDAAGLYSEFAVSKTRDGDEVLAQVEDGTLTDLSVGFRPITDKWSRARDFVERLESKLLEVSIVNTGAYHGAKILAVRSDGSPYALSNAAARLRLMQMESN